MPKPKKTTNEAILERLIDELGCVQQRLAVAKLDEKRERELKAAILLHFPKLAPEGSKIAAGVGFDVVISAQDEQRTLDYDKVIEKLGVEKYVELSKITLTALEGELGADETEKLCTRQRTGSRTIKTIPRAA